MDAERQHKINPEGFPDKPDLEHQLEGNVLKPVGEPLVEGHYSPETQREVAVPFEIPSLPKKEEEAPKHALNEVIPEAQRASVLERIISDGVPPGKEFQAISDLAEQVDLAENQN